MERKFDEHSSCGWSQLNFLERRERLLKEEVLSPDDVIALTACQLPPQTADTMVENMIGIYEIPLSIVPGAEIDGKTYFIPMANEEPSVVAAATRCFKWIHRSGSVQTEIRGREVIGQIFFSHVKNPESLELAVLNHRDEMISYANGSSAASMKQHGGGVTAIEVRSIIRPDGKTAAIVHVILNPCKAVGSNIVTQICDQLATTINHFSGEEVGMRIVSNYADKRLVSARVVLCDVEQKLGERIEDASLMAQIDKYRAATHNKGIMNGVHGVVLATGNDTRAIEAGAHAWAARDGVYRGLSRWSMQEGKLIGEITIPMVVGVVGGTINIHPGAKRNLQILGVESADELARVITAVGLVQNLGALTALSQEGITQCHMHLHAKTLMAATNATIAEQPILLSQLRQKLRKTGRLTESDAHTLLAEIRSNEHNHNGLMFQPKKSFA